MKNISGFISKAVLLLLALGLFGQVSAQDTLRTYGPRIGIDLARFIYILADPSETGAELSVDFEIYKNIYPVFEAGYSSISESEELFDYSASGSYGRVGIDYNVLPTKDRSLHHSITVGFRYGMSVFKHRSENAVIVGEYWGDFAPDPYENNLTGHWLELVGGMKAELLPNFFLGWSVRYKFLLNPDMDPFMVPELIPGYGTGGESSKFGFTYSVFYKFPLIKK
ncbi:MAG: DUF6048 family protein [Bacteroidota bacterium]|nr:DUF6048 family protein [Bacteroidota bacterium]